MAEQTSLRISVEFMHNKPCDVELNIFGNFRPTNNGTTSDKLHTIKIVPQEVATQKLTMGKYLLILKGFVRQNIEIEDGVSEQSVTLKIPPFKRVHGRITDSQGELIPDAYAVAVPSDPLSDKWIFTAKSGEYQSIVFEGNKGIGFGHANYAPIIVNDEIFQHELGYCMDVGHDKLDEIARLDVQLPRGGTLKGIFKTRDGSPLPSELFLSFSHGELYRYHAPHQVAEDGRFEFIDCMPTGQTTLYYQYQDDEGDKRLGLGHHPIVVSCEPNQESYVEILI